MIFYFTATGNSKYIAEKIAAETSDRLIDIAECVQAGNFAFDLADGEAVGLVVPVYWFGIPMIVTEFLQMCLSSQNSNLSARKSPAVVNG